MPYSELIKNFERIRDYMRQFYVYGFKSREEYQMKSARSYDNERRRLESWLGDCLSFRRDEDGKRVFLSVDSLAIPSNPLYQAFKAKSFTAGDIMFHFYILDLLADHKPRTVRAILSDVESDYLSHFPAGKALDESTVRKKLKEYEALGLLISRKDGRELVYGLAPDTVEMDCWKEAVAFYAEEDPLGVIGSFLLDRCDAAPSVFSFKHHYMLYALDSEILCALLLAMEEHRCAELTVLSPRGEGQMHTHTVFPWKILISTQTGRQYLLGYHYRFHRPMIFRLDNLRAVKAGAVEQRHGQYDGWCEKYRENLWGTSAGTEPSLDHLEMTVRVEDGEGFILERLEREKRCGRVEVAGAHSYRFCADVYDAVEMLPWLRTFIGRVEKLVCSNPYVVQTFYDDLAAMRAMYGGACDAVQ